MTASKPPESARTSQAKTTPPAGDKTPPPAEDKPRQTAEANKKAKQPSSLSLWEPLRFVPVILAIAFGLATILSTWTPGVTAPGASVLRDIKPIQIIATQVESGTPVIVSPTPSLRRIGIVSGHWGHDSGAVCPDGLQEMDVNLQTASQVQKLLVDQGYEVDLLEEFDLRLSQYKAAVLVSIHSDSCEYYGEQATGFKVAASMANPYPERSAKLTSCLRNRYMKKSGLPIHSMSVTPDMTSYHAFGEIDPDTTAAIIELGFLNMDRDMLENHTDELAQGIVDGILCYMNKEKIE
jgi:N-acetylmuramoyl-L-alanine amidase